MAGTKKTDRRRRRAVAVLGMLVLLAVGMRAHADPEGVGGVEPMAVGRVGPIAVGRIERIALEGDGATTKVVITLSRPLAFEVKVLDGDAARKSARRLVLDFENTTLAPGATEPITAASSELLRQIRPGQFNARTARIVLDLASDATHSVDAVESPPQVTIALAGTAAPGTPATAGTTTNPGTPSTAATDVSKPPVRTIPIRARWRKPYSLIYPR